MMLGLTLIVSGMTAGSTASAREATLTSGPRLVVILAGSSNAAGAGAAWSYLTPEEQSELQSWGAQTKFMDNRHFDADGNPVYEYTVPITWQRKSGGHERFGAEMSFAETMEKLRPPESLYILKYTIGGSSIDDWNGQLWAGFEAFLQLGLSKIDKPYRIAGMMWIQDGADANPDDEENALTYKEDTRTFFERVRALLNSPKLSIAIVQEPNEAGMTPECIEKLTNERPYMPVIHDAKVALANEMSGVVYIDTTSYTYAKDCVHFDTASQLALGRTLAEFATSEQKRRSRPGP